MEQKDYKMEIVLDLLKGDNHIRGISKNLSINHMRIVREIATLENLNVVDYKREGKNKVYSLKKTSETKSIVYSAEHYKLTRFLMKYPLLRTIIEKIQNDHRIQLAILFGSYAKGRSKDESDIDLYVESPRVQLKKDIQKLDTRLSVHIGTYNTLSPLLKEIQKNHVIVKGVETYYEKNNFFG